MLRLIRVAACLWLLAMIAASADATPRPLAPPVQFTPFAYDPTFRRAWIPEHDGMWRLPVATSGTSAWQWLHVSGAPATLAPRTLTVREPYGTPIHVAPNGAAYALTPPDGCPSCLEGWQWVSLNATGAPAVAGPVIYDDLHDRVLMVGPLGEVSAMQFVLNGGWTGAWTSLPVVAPLPAPQDDAALAVDRERDQLVLAGGRSPCPFDHYPSTHVWVMSLAGPGPYQWTALPDVPFGGAESDLVVDNVYDRLLWVGGHNLYDCGGGPTEFSSSTVYALPLAPVGSWTAVGTVTFGDNVEPAASGFDPGRGLLAFGGTKLGPGIQPDLAIREVLIAPLQPSLSFQPFVPGAPVARGGPQVAFDAAAGVLLMQGGQGATSKYGDYATFGDGSAWDGALWNAGASGPPLAHAATVATGNQEFLVFGGFYDSPTPPDPPQYSAEVHSVSVPNSTWQTLAVPPGPTPRIGAAAAYDGAGDRLLVFGGQDLTGTRTDLWSLDLNAHDWTEALPSGFTPPVAPAAAAWDAAASRLYLAAVSAPGSVLVWYADAGLTQFTVVPTTGAGPAHVYSLDLDPVAHALIALDDGVAAWRLPLSGPAQWQQLDGSTRPLGPGWLFVDGDHALAVYDTPPQLFEVSLTPVVATPDPLSAPSALTLRIAGPHPARAPRVAFSLPHAAPARIELFDVAGRRVWARDLAGPGTRELSIGDGPLAAGVYQARLSHSGAHRTIRLVVLP